MIHIQQGDSLKLMKTIPDSSIDMILCDLPYGVTARNKWDTAIPFESLWEQYERIIKENAAVVLFGSGMFTADLMESNRKLWKYNLIWEKTQPTGHLNAHRMPLRCHEDILVFYKKLPIYNPQKTSGHVRKVSRAAHHRTAKKTLNYGDYHFTDYESTERFPRSILTFPKDTQKNALHPTQKPVALMEYLIKTYTNKGDTVLDNCMGGGSTGVACIHTGRNFIGYELDKDIFKAAHKRIMSAVKKEE